MVAVAHRPPAATRLVVVRSSPAPRPVPVTGPPAPAVYRRRRAVAGAAASAVVLALSLAVQSASGASGGAPATSPERPAVSGTVYVVQPGDTFWSIARTLRPEDDPRTLVARLVAAHGGSALRSGERISIPAEG